MRLTGSVLAVASVLVAGLGLGLGAQQKTTAPAAAGAKPVVSVYKSPT